MSLSKKISYLILGVSMFIFQLAIVALMIFPPIYERKLKEGTNLVKDSIVYDLWIDLPLPIYQRLYFFNITNPEDFMKYGAKLELKEVGPYTYKSHWQKKDAKWNANGTVTYREVKTYNFVREKSAGSESDEIYTLNGPLIMASDFLKEKLSLTRISANRAFTLFGKTLIIKEAIGKLAFSGYTDTIIGMSHLFRTGAPFKGMSFAWLYGRNDTDDGVFTVFTGEEDHTLLNIIDRWNGKAYLPYWKNNFCNQINGTNAEFGPPLLKNQLEYTFYQPIFCRSITFSHAGNMIHKGLLSKRFENSAEIFNKTNPDNFCFDSDTDLKSGVLDVSSCQFGAPIVLSFPHFYLADPEFLDNINGLNPNKENHSSYIDIEPLSGITVDLSIKLQINMKVECVKHLSAFKNIVPGVYPIFWVEMSAELTDDIADFMKNKIYKPKILAYITILGIIIVSVIMLIPAIIKLIKIHQTSFEYSERLPLVSNRSDSFVTTRF